MPLLAPPWTTNGYGSRSFGLTLVEEVHLRRLAAGADGELVADLSQLVRAHPLRERLWSSLIVAQYRAGQQADALRSYEGLRATLAETLGLDPSPELQSLQLRVLRQDPGLLPALAPRSQILIGDSSLPAETTSFVESSGIINAIQELVAAHRLVTLTGPGGIGKTRLAIEMGRRGRAGFRMVFAWSNGPGRRRRRGDDRDCRVVGSDAACRGDNARVDP